MIHILGFLNRELGMKLIIEARFELYGCYLAGNHYPLLGHNRDYAYGLTMFENDVIDLNKNNPILRTIKSIKLLMAK
jgi:hypothetical protein